MQDIRHHEPLHGGLSISSGQDQERESDIASRNAMTW